MCMAKMEAFKILISSIFSGDTMPIPIASAFLLIKSTKKGLSFFLVNLLSIISIQNNSLGQITAAATTGPAKHPLPASSQPTSISKSSWKYVLILLLFKLLFDLQKLFWLRLQALRFYTIDYLF